MEPIRIAVVIGKISYGGIENVVANYYKAIDKNRIQFDFYYGSNSLEPPKEEFLAMGARYYVLPPTKNPFGFVKELRKHLREKKYTILHAHMNTLSFLALYAAYKEGVPVRICHNHSVPSGEAAFKKAVKTTLKELSKRWATDNFACAEKAGRWFYGDKAFETGKVIVVPNAVEFSRFAFSSEKRADVRKRLGIDNKIVIGHVGRFTYAKNHSFLLEVFRKVLEKNNNAVLVLVGDGELKEQVLSKIDTLGIKEHVILVGQTKTPEDYYSAFDVMMLPSVFEGLPMTVVECQASQRPMVVSEVTPDEAIFSNGIVRASLSSSAEEWAEKVMEASKIKVVLDERSDRFRIEKQAEFLASWYEAKNREVKNV